MVNIDSLHARSALELEKLRSCSWLSATEPPTSLVCAPSMNILMIHFDEWFRINSRLQPRTVPHKAAKSALARKKPSAVCLLTLHSARPLVSLPAIAAQHSSPQKKEAHNRDRPHAQEIQKEEAHKRRGRRWRWRHFGGTPSACQVHGKYGKQFGERELRAVCPAAERYGQYQAFHFHPVDGLQGLG